jgi:hypothetical protein
MHYVGKSDGFGLKVEEIEDKTPHATADRMGRGT